MRVVNLRLLVLVALLVFHEARGELPRCLGLDERPAGCPSPSSRGLNSSTCGSRECAAFYVSLDQKNPTECDADGVMLREDLLNSLDSSCFKSLRGAESAESSPPPSRTVQVSGSATTSSTRGSIGVFVGPLAAIVMLVVASVLFSSHRREMRASRVADPDPLAPDEISASYILDGDDEPVNFSKDGHVREMDKMLDADKTLKLRRVDPSDISDIHSLAQGDRSFLHLVALRNGTLAASKRLATRPPTLESMAELIAQVHVVARLQHRCVVRFLGASWTSSLDLQLLYEFVSGGDLDSYLSLTKSQRHQDATWQLEKLEIALDIAEGLLYLHSFNPPIVYRDLEPRNILLTETCRAKLSGLGRTRQRGRNARWLAPEILEGRRTPDAPSDMYSFGMMLIELNMHELDGENRSSQREIAQINLGRPDSSSCPAEIQILVERCTAMEPSERPDALELAFQLRKLVDSRQRMTR